MVPTLKSSAMLEGMEFTAGRERVNSGGAGFSKVVEGVEARRRRTAEGGDEGTKWWAHSTVTASKLKGMKG